MDPDITVLVTGKSEIGKDTVAALIANKLKGTPLGYDVFVEDPEIMFKGDGGPDDLASPPGGKHQVVRAAIFKFTKKPAWDGQVRVVHVKTKDAK